MDLNYGSEYDDFRNEVQAFVKENEGVKLTGPMRSESRIKWQQTLIDNGYFARSIPKEYGGHGGDMDIIKLRIIAEEFAKSPIPKPMGGQGIQMLVPTLLELGTEEQKQKFIPPVVRGEKIAALAMTEPSGGSDVASLKTRAVRKGDHFIVNGSKMFITSGMRADTYVVGVSTGGEGATGISVLVIEKDTPGFTQTPLKKMGWLSSDTAVLYFDDCKVPVENLIGGENSGWIGVMSNFSQERLGMAAGMNAYSQICIDEAVAWAKERKTFGKPLIDNQVIKHKLVDMNRAVKTSRAWTELLSWRVMNGESPIADLAMLKVHASKAMELCAREAMQILGGAGYLRANSGPGKVERIYREVRVNAIGGGSEEIMYDLAARQLGYRS